MINQHVAFALSFALAEQTLRFTVLFFSSAEVQSELSDAVELEEKIASAKGGVIFTYPSPVRFSRDAVGLLIMFFKENLVKTKNRGLALPGFLAECFTKAIADTEGEYIKSGIDVRQMSQEATDDLGYFIRRETAKMWLSKGFDLGTLGPREEQLNCYDRALAIDPDFSEAWMNKGAALGQLGRHKEALVCLDHALALEPSNLGTWINKGVAFRGLAQPMDALTCFDRALDLNPVSELAWFQKGATFFDLKRFQEALPCFQEAHRLGHAQAAQMIELFRKLLGKHFPELFLSPGGPRAKLH